MTLAFDDSTISKIMADAAKIGLNLAVVIDGVVGVGFLDENAAVLVADGNRGGVIGPVTTITVQTSAFPASSLKVDKAITFAGNPYTIRSALPEGDTGFTRLLLGSV
jgi:hypothetical protein